MKVRIGTRASKLAMFQAETAARAIEEARPGIETEIVPITTTGDRILDRTLDKIGGKGLFVRELDAALLDGRVDITVHSCKDVPMEVDERIPIVAASKREDPRDVLVLPLGRAERDPSLPIGSSSARRRVQLREIFPDARVQSVRGNVITRLEKLDSGEFGALILAAAGLTRLGLSDRVSKAIPVEDMLPAAGQAIMAVQARAGEDVSWLSGFHDEQVFRCMLAERAFVRELDGGCSKPCAAFAQAVGDDSGTTEIDGSPDAAAGPDALGALVLTGLYVSDDETELRRGSVRLEGGYEEIESGAAALARRLKQDGVR